MSPTKRVSMIVGSTVTVLALMLPLASARAQQSDADAVKAAVDTYNAAISARDAKAMDALWAHEPDAILVNPRDKTITVGWDAIKQNWDTVFGSWSSLKVTRTTGTVRVNGGIAWATSLAEVVGTAKDGTALDAPTFESDVFVKRGDRWLLVSHSAWRVPK
jgi:ketosteroid isomerase-like protein